MPKMSTAADFWARVDIRSPDVCWNWSGKSLTEGYGQLGYRGEHWLSHRLAAVLSGMSIPPTACVLHTCDNRLCCNPAHFFLGTRADNAQDRERKRRGTYGEDRPKAKLTDLSVREARASYAGGGVTFGYLAQRYGVGKQTMHKAVSGETWKHVK